MITVVLGIQYIMKLLHGPKFVTKNQIARWEVANHT